MQKKTTSPLAVKITKNETQDHTNQKSNIKGESNSWKNRNFGYLFNILEQMQVFPTSRAADFEHKLYFNKQRQRQEKKRASPISAKLIVAMHLYEGPVFDFSYAENENLQEAREVYQFGIDRLDALRRGTASLMNKEAEYFYEAFRLAFGNQWAEKTSPEHLVKGDIRDLVQQLISDSVPVNWNTKNQLDILKVIINSRKNKPIEADIQTFGDHRLSNAGNNLPEDMRFICTSSDLI